MTHITAHIGTELYKTEIKTTFNSILADEPKESGGQDLGFSATELLAASLGACTSITLRMYADRKGWKLTDVQVEVDFKKDDVNKKSNFTRTIKLTGELSNEQRDRLLVIANSCPVHKILSNPIEIETILN